MSRLDEYVERVLTPTEAEVRFLKARMRRINKVLTDNSKNTPMEIHNGGSLEKGTMLRHHLDGDLVCVYNQERDVAKDWRRLANAAYETLQTNFPKSEVEPAGNLAVHFKTTYKDPDGNEKAVNVDVVPCYYVNSPIVMQDHTGSNLYTAITTIWHPRYLQYYKSQPYFTAAVRLLKDWKNEHDVPLKGIHLELIAADVYDRNIEHPEYIREVDEVLTLCF